MTQALLQDQTTKTAAPNGQQQAQSTSGKPETLILDNPALRGILPPTFNYAASTAAYQIEGAAFADGKKASVWDDFLKDTENGEDACDSYHLFKEDIKLLKEYGVNTYRFSVSWPRVIPDGSGKVNEKGIQYYSDLVDALLAEGITPFVTIFHWDTPAALQAAYGGFDNERIVADFVAFSKVLFERLGDRVKNWITINEPFIYTLLNCAALKSEGWKDSNWATHTRNLILAHAYTADLYRREFAGSEGQIGITLNMDWVVPIDDSEAAKTCASDLIDLWLGIYTDPIYNGNFPQTCIDRFGDILSYTPEQWAVVKGSNDFFGLNHYSTSYATGKMTDASSANAVQRAFGLQERVTEIDGKPIGNRGENGHPYDVPWGFRLLLNYISDKYTKKAGHSIYITENGFATEAEADLPLEQQIADTQRQQYFAGYLNAMVEAMQDGVDVGGYMAWSLLDNLEWTQGYRPRFGLTVVDRSTPEFKRHPKDSGRMLAKVFDYLISKPQK